ncbi:MAG: hypothetical protein R3D33_18640 [Hyphomicrobiaceae bacterium]
MIITHTADAHGNRRLYIGGKGSLDCWLEPEADGRRWTFHLEEAFAGNRLTPADKHDWAVHRLLQLAEALAVAPEDLVSVPFEAIAALHAADPYAGRRVPVGRRKLPENAFLATAPGITRPRADFHAGERPRHQRQR